MTLDNNLMLEVEMFSKYKFATVISLIGVTMTLGHNDR